MLQKILIVDDSLAVREQIRVALSPIGAEVHCADGPITAINLFREHKDFCLVILDVNMPQMDGIQLLDILKGMPDSTPFHVIIHSTEAGPALKQAAREKGANLWAIKPVAPNDLRLAVQQLLGLTK